MLDMPHTTRTKPRSDLLDLDVTRKAWEAPAWSSHVRDVTHTKQRTTHGACPRHTHVWATCHKSKDLVKIGQGLGLLGPSRGTQVGLPETPALSVTPCNARDDVAAQVTAMYSEEGERLELAASFSPTASNAAAERWLDLAESAMRDSVRSVVEAALHDHAATPRLEWLLKWPGQVGCLIWLLKDRGRFGWLSVGAFGLAAVVGPVCLGL